MLGTFSLVLIGEGSVAQTVLTQKEVEVPIINASNPQSTIGSFHRNEEGLYTFFTIVIGHFVSSSVVSCYATLLFVLLSLGSLAQYAMTLTPQSIFLKFPHL